MTQQHATSAAHDQLAALMLKTFVFTTTALAASAWPGIEHGKRLTNGAFTTEETGTGALVAAYPDDGFGRLTVTTGANAARVTADYSSAGTANHNAVYWFRDQAISGQQNRAYPADHVDGIYGQGAPQTPAITIVPANTTVTLLVRGEASAGNQRMIIGSTLTVEEI